MKQIDSIRNALNTALARLEELEQTLEHRAPALYEWDATTICSVAAEEFGVGRDSLYVKARDRAIVDARHTAIYLMKKYLGMSATQIATHFRSDMNRSTVNYAVSGIRDKIEQNLNFSAKIIRAESKYLIAKNERNTNENDQSK
jgi:chromosomal replication initiation ATPase DnaA